MRMTTKLAICCMGVSGLVACGAEPEVKPQAPENFVWSSPVSNPVYSDTAMIRRELRVVYVQQDLPSHIKTTLGKLPLDGDLNAVAVQLEWPLTESLSLVANKSGYIDFNPENTLSKQEGYADLSAGLKWAFKQDDNLALALRATVEMTTGSDRVLQQNGDGHISPALLMTRFCGRTALNGVLGATIPFDSSEESTLGYLSLAAAYSHTQKLSSHVELNWFRVLANGHGEASSDKQLGGTLIGSVTQFEGGDLINLGSEDGNKHANFVSLAIGARYMLTNNFSLAVAYEAPLTSKDLGLMEDRVTTTLTYNF